MLIGSQPPVIEVVCDPEGDPPGMTYFTVVFSDAPPPDEVSEEDCGELVCAHCLLDEQPELGAGMDLALRHGGSAIRDAHTGEWSMLPEDDPAAPGRDD